METFARALKQMQTGLGCLHSLFKSSKTPLKSSTSKSQEETDAHCPSCNKDYWVNKHDFMWSAPKGGLRCPHCHERLAAGSMPKTEKRELWEIMVPASNRKQEFSYEHHKAWDEFVLSLAGGLTIYKTGKGEWLCPAGEKYNDRVIPVRIACDRATIEKIIAFTITHYKQLAVMAYKISDEVIIQHA